MTINNFIDLSNQYMQLLEQLSNKLTQIIQLTQSITLTQLPTLLNYLIESSTTVTEISTNAFTSTLKTVFPTVGYAVFEQVVQFNQSLNKLDLILAKIDEIRGTIQLAYNITGNSDYTLFSDGYNTNSLQWHNTELSQFIAKIEKLTQSINEFLTEVT